MARARYDRHDALLLSPAISQVSVGGFRPAARASARHLALSHAAPMASAQAAVQACASAASVMTFAADVTDREQARQVMPPLNRMSRCTPSCMPQWCWTTRRSGLTARADLEGDGAVAVSACNLHADARCSSGFFVLFSSLAVMSAIRE
jgi:hypothetical protein